MIQFIVHHPQTSEELRELERQLKIAYTKKGRAAQDKERALLRDVDAYVDACVQAFAGLAG